MYIEYKEMKINFNKFVKVEKGDYKIGGVMKYYVDGYTKFGQRASEAQYFEFNTAEERDEFWNKIK